MTDNEWPKQIEHKGITVTLTMRFGFPLTDYGYELPGGVKGAGFLSAGAARAAAEKAVDRMLAREKAKA